MARIIRKNTQNTSIREAFVLFISHSTAKGLKEKSLQTYQQHFNSISKRLNVDVPIPKHLSGLKYHRKNFFISEPVRRLSKFLKIPVTF